MEINLNVYCGRESNGVSQGEILLDALEGWRDEIQGGQIYDDTAQALRLLADLTERLSRGMLKALEDLEPLTVWDGKGAYRDVYESRSNPNVRPCSFDNPDADLGPDKPNPTAGEGQAA